VSWSRPRPDISDGRRLRIITRVRWDDQAAEVSLTLFRSWHSHESRVAHKSRHVCNVYKSADFCGWCRSLGGDDGAYSDSQAPYSRSRLGFPGAGHRRATADRSGSTYRGRISDERTVPQGLVAINNW
jgi:hypothetical protein